MCTLQRRDEEWYENDVVVVEVQAILRLPQSGALALPHNEDVKVKCSWAANLGKVSKVQIALLAIALLK